MTQTNAGTKTFTAAEALAKYRRVKLYSSTSGSVHYADADEECIGVTLEAAASGAMVAVGLLGIGTQKCTASAAVAANADIYSQADGKVDDAGAGSGSSPIGKALEAALADGDIIECAFNAKYDS